MGAWSYPPHRLPVEQPATIQEGLSPSPRLSDPLGHNPPHPVSASSLSTQKRRSMLPRIQPRYRWNSDLHPWFGKKLLVYPSSEAPSVNGQHLESNLRPSSRATKAFTPLDFIPGSQHHSLVRLLRVRILSCLASSPGNSHLLEALDTLEWDDIDQQQFLRRAGSLIEQWIPEEAMTMKHVRSRKEDQYCYRPDGVGRSITESRRQVSTRPTARHQKHRHYRPPCLAIHP